MSRSADEEEEDDIFVIKRSAYTPKSLVDLVDDDDDDGDERSEDAAANKSKAGGGMGRNPFERILASSKENQIVSKKLKLSSASTTATSTTASTTAAAGESDLPAVEQRFTVDLVRYLLSLKTGSSEVQQAKFSTDSLKAIGELMHIFVIGGWGTTPSPDGELTFEIQKRQSERKTRRKRKMTSQKEE